VQVLGMDMKQVVNRLLESGERADG
jgi:hypothetical protein